jgi:hypothetical protein
LIGKPEGKRPLLRPRGRWENNIRMDLREIGWGGVDWINLTQNRESNFLITCVTISLSRRPLLHGVR